MCVVVIAEFSSVSQELNLIMGNITNLVSNKAMLNGLVNH